MANVNKVKAQGAIYDIEDTAARTSSVVVTSKADGSVELRSPTSTVTVPSITNFGGQPIPVTLASEMTDTSKIYVYLGEEEGYDYGYVYAYVDEAWVNTGLYGRGSDGFSPTVTVTETATGATIKVTDKSGTSTASVANGTATDAQVADWLDAHPEATTTVQDGSITTVKLADDAVTTDKVVDHNITMDKTDFYYQRSLQYTLPSWMTKTVGAKSGGIHVNASDLETAVPNFPNSITVIGKHASQYGVSSYGAGITCRSGTWQNKVTNIEKTTTRYLVDGNYYYCLTVTKEAVEDAYALYLEDLNNGYYPRNDASGGLNLGINRTSDAFADVYVVANVEVTEEMIASNFSETVMSEDFATAVKRALESDEGTSTDEETAKEALTGKVMVCLGDSYTVGMGSLLSTIATKYGMAIDNRGVVSSSICGDVNGNKGFSPMWNRANTIVSNYSSGYTIDGTSYTADDVGVIVFMGGANDGFGVETWIGTGIHETDTNTIYGACNHIFNVLAKTFTKAKLICITQPSSYARSVSSISDDATAQTLGFENLAELQVMDDIQFSNYAMTQKEKAVYDTAWAYGWDIIDMFHDMPTIFNPSNRSAYWQSDKLHLTSAGYTLISNALDKKIVELVVG